MAGKLKLFLIILALPLSAYLGFEIRYFNAAYPNTYIGNFDVSGKSRGEIEKLLQKEFESRENKTFVLHINQSDAKSITLNKNLVNYDIKRSVDITVGYGRTGSLKRQLTEKLESLTQKHTIVPVYEFDSLTFDTLLADTVRPYEKDIVETKLVFSPSGPALSPSKPGLVAQRYDIANKVTSYIEMTSGETTFDVKFETQEPQITRENSQEALSQAKIAVTKQIVLMSKEIPNKTWTIGPNQLKDFISFTFDTDKNKGTLTIVNYKVAEYTAQIAPLIDKPAIEPKYETINGKKIVIQPSQNGRELDTAVLTKQIEQQAFNPSFSPSIELPIKTVTPALALEKVNEYGIQDLIASGQTNFKGSSQARIHNIETAAEKLNGVIIKSNEKFSMYKTVGDIEKTTGYQDSFVIKNGRTVPGIGGGVCQVSTTLFRAALNAGLQINERHPHSYRIAYYEVDSPPGLDASIYFPTWDLKFTNNTGNNILIQTKMDKAKSTLTFNLYGVKDGRAVQIQQPQITNVIPAPPEVRINDNAIDKGIIRQIDFAAPGSDITVQRTVIKDGKIIIDEPIKSHYYPWQAVYLIGTKTDQNTQ
jgi:vancomycin resistance protein YoaR